MRVYDGRHSLDSKIVVFGDIMMDVYIDVADILPSAEADVSVLRVSMETQPKLRLGGAANVAANVSAMTGNTTDLLCRVDYARGRQAWDDFDALAKEHNVNLVPVYSPEFRLPLKTRYMNYNKQVVRVDINDYSGFDYGPPTMALMRGLLSRMNSSQHLIVSDYRKGLFTDRSIPMFMTALRTNNKPLVYLDSKPCNFFAFRHHVDYMSPNEAEMLAYLNTFTPQQRKIEAPYEILHEFIDHFPGVGIMGTYGKRGMIFQRGDAISLAPPENVDQAIDVCGAGDTALAAFTVCRSRGLDEHTSVLIANAAAGLVVTKPMTSVVTKEEFDAIYLRFTNKESTK